MSNKERDTHFQGFAKLLYPELARFFLALYTARVLGDEQQVKRAEQLIKEYLAQRAYDLSLHTLEKFERGYDWGFGTLDTPLEVMQEIPDLTEWPTT